MKLSLVLILTVIFTSCESGSFSQVSSITKNIKLDDPKRGGGEVSPSPRQPQSQLPSCFKLCEKVSHFKNIKDDGFGYLAFTNFGHRGIGRCRGHALLTQKMFTLARFKEGAGCDLNESACFNKVKAGILKIKNYQTYDFSGYKNLFEFSSDPKVYNLLRGIVATTSNRYRAVAGHIRNRSYTTEALNVFHEVKRRLALGQIPYVGVLGALTGSHAVLFYEDTYLGNKNILCVKDPNFLNRRSENCDNYFYIDKTEVYFKRLDRPADLMTRFNLTSDEDNRVRAYLSALALKCEAEGRKQHLCK